jgi:beta-lactamase regulating signal transducer with metallopeptidase domain
MSKDKKIFIIGIVLVLLGLALKFALPDSNADNLAIAQQAQSAQEAAQAIASNNQSDVLTSTIGMFLLGLGGVLTVVGGLKMVSARKA